MLDSGLYFCYFKCVLGLVLNCLVLLVGNEMLCVWQEALQPALGKRGRAVECVTWHRERRKEEKKQRCKFHLQPRFQAKLPVRCQRCAWKSSTQTQFKKKTHISRCKIGSLSGKWVCFEGSHQYCCAMMQKEKYATFKEPVRQYHTERKMEESRLFLAPVKTNIQINWFSNMSPWRDLMEVFKLSCPPRQPISSVGCSQGEMPDDKIGRQQIENQNCSGKTGGLFRSFNSLLANKDTRQSHWEHGRRTMDIASRSVGVMLSLYCSSIARRGLGD